MTDTTLLALPLILAAQGQKHVTHNEAIRLLDGIVQCSVINQTRTTPPGSPAAGDRYIVAASATGLWAGFDTCIAYWVSSAWVKLTPKIGWQVYDRATGLVVIWSGSAWAASTVSGLAAKQDISEKGAASGYASLNANGKVPASQLPGGSDVQDYANLAAFPGTGMVGIIYVALNTDLTYLWDDESSTYVQQGSGSTASTLMSMPAVGFKQPCRMVAISNIDLATGGVVSVDGRNTVAGDPILCAGQTLPEQNGIYVAAAGAWARRADANTVAKMRGAVVTIWQGATYGSSVWHTTFKQGNVLGTTAMNWYQLVGTDNVVSVINTLLGSTSWQGGGYTTEEAQDAVGAMVTDGTLLYVDATPILKRAPVTGHVTIGDGSNTAALGSFTVAHLNTALNDGDAATLTGSETLTNKTLTNAIVGTQSAGDNSTKAASTAYADNPVGKRFELIIAASDETTALTTGVAKTTFRMPRAVTLTDVRASVTTAPTGATLLTVDIKESGTTIFSTKLTFDATEKTTTTAATPRVISDTALADDAEMTINIDAVGSTIAGAGLKVTLIGTYS